MYIYILIYCIVLGLAITQQNKTVSKSFFITCCLLIGLFVGLGDMLGGFDRYIYGEWFQTQSVQITNKQGIFNPSYFLFFGHEPGFGLWNSLIGYFTPNRYIYILITTLVIYLLLAINIYRSTRQPFWGLVLFMGIMFFFTFTYIRQILAAMIVWYSIPYIEKRNLLKFSFFVLLGATIHNSAILFFIAYFIPHKKYSIAQILSVMAILLVLGLTGITARFFAIYGDTIQDAANKAELYIRTSQEGFRLEYFLEASLFLILLFINYNRIDAKDKHQLVYTNIYLLFCGTLLFFVKSSDGGRLAWYSTLGIIAIISNLCYERPLLSLRLFVSILSFTLFFRILIGWGTFISPYKSFLTPGIRSEDRIYLEYEYDYSYKYDKLYNL